MLLCFTVIWLTWDVLLIAFSSCFSLVYGSTVISTKPSVKETDESSLGHLRKAEGNLQSNVSIGSSPSSKMWNINVMEVELQYILPGRNPYWSWAQWWQRCTITFVVAFSCQLVTIRFFWQQTNKIWWITSVKTACNKANTHSFASDRALLFNRTHTFTHKLNC